MNLYDLGAIEALIFDVYDTIVEVRDKRNPFGQLLRIGRRQGRSISSQDAAVIMSLPLSLRAAAELFGIELSAPQLAHLENELRSEIASIRLFPDTIHVMQQMRKRGLKLGLCSNLAADYADPIISLLPFRLSAYTWSFEAGAVKPDPAIYANACKVLDCAPAHVLMIGDSQVADFDGPRAFGMRSFRLDRKLTHSAKFVLPSLLSLLDTKFRLGCI